MRPILHAPRFRATEKVRGGATPLKSTGGRTISWRPKVRGKERFGGATLSYGEPWGRQGGLKTQVSFGLWEAVSAFPLQGEGEKNGEGSK